MNDPRDPFQLSRKKVFLWGAFVTILLCALVYFFVPGEPKNTLMNAPLTGPGSVSASLEGSSTAQNGAVPSSPLIVTDEKSNGTPAQLYSKFCSACHGDDGKANTAMARMMSVHPANLVDGPFKFERSESAVAELIKNGSGVMPGYGRELGDEKALALAKYVLGLEKKEH